MTVQKPSDFPQTLTCPSLPFILILQVWEGPRASSILHPGLPFCDLLDLQHLHLQAFLLASLPATFFSHLWCVHLILPNTLSTKKLSFRTSAQSTTHLRQISFQQQNKIRTACDQIQPPPNLELWKCQNTGWVQVLLRPKAHIWGRMIQSCSNVAATYSSSLCGFYKLAWSLLLNIIPLQYSHCLRVQEFLMLALFK